MTMASTDPKWSSSEWMGPTHCLWWSPPSDSTQTCYKTISSPVISGFFLFAIQSWVGYVVRSGSEFKAANSNIFTQPTSQVHNMVTATHFSRIVDKDKDKWIQRTHSRSDFSQRFVTFDGFDLVDEEKISDLNNETKRDRPIYQISQELQMLFSDTLDC